ncbi:histidine kinase dimerization/phospho-acceptor domain-containing protein [Roseibium alexandrii]|uniref:histidine kinase dimerization/phospho-acceptor domain-containing protein n=1 Tax=Roseibium alexandrii TaxID=388408 RepID=UPI0037516CE9
MAVDITRKALYVLAASGLAMMLLAVLVVRAVFNPLKRIAGGLAERDPHDLTPLDTDVPRETAMMIQALNAFMGRLDRQMNSMRHLISDTAHQLRTPVAALRAQADLFSDEEDPERKDRIVERIQTRSTSLGRLLDQMLSQALVIHRGDSVRRKESIFGMLCWTFSRRATMQFCGRILLSFRNWQTNQFMCLRIRLPFKKR